MLLQGSLTYAGILGTLISTVFGNFFSKDEAEALASAIFAIVSLAVTAYGRYRIKSVVYEK